MTVVHFARGRQQNGISNGNSTENPTSLYVDKIPSRPISPKKENGIPNLAIPTVDTIEDSFSATRESLEILEMVPLDSPSDDE